MRHPSPAIDRSTSPLRSTSGQSIPLLAVELAGEVVGGHARIVSTQRYRHDERQPVEAVYVFPLPSDAAVTGFTMEVAGRRLEAEVKEREEAFRAYDDAITSGHGAALVEQERANVFTASVGNLLPGEEVLIAISFVLTMPGDEGSLRLSIPTLVAPRYVPGQQAGDRTGHGAAEPTNRVPDADRISPKIDAVGYTLSVDLALHFDAQAVIRSPSHSITAAHDGTRWRVTLAGAPLDRDLVVVIEPEERAALERVVAHRGADGEGHVALTWVPDLARLVPDDRKHGTFSFVLDRSGSMGGLSIEEARRALRLCLRQLREGDRFEVIAFDDHVESFRPEPVPYTERTLSEADRWITSIEARGGTELLAPMVQAARHGGVVVLLTDGQVGNEDEILRAVLSAAERASGGETARIYTFGIGTNVSDVLLGELARRTGGAMELIHPGERIDEKVVATFARAHAVRVRAPVLEVSGVEIDELAPSRTPDIVDGEPWTVLGRYARGGRAEVRIRGTLAGQPFVHVLIADLPDRSEADLVPTLWARERLRDLEAQEVTGRRATTMKERIVGIAKKHHLASRHTSFVVVEKRTGDRRVTEAAATRPIPVSAPHGWTMLGPARERFRHGPPPTLGTVISARAPTGGMLGAPAPRLASAGPAGPPPGVGRRYEIAPAGVGPPPPPRAVRRRLARADDEAESDHMDAFAFADSGAPSIPSGARPRAAEKTRSRAATSGVERVLEAQRASGLWDADASSLAQTIAALRALLVEGVTTAHATFGANAKKAVEAVVAIASDARIPLAERENALLLAYLIASGRKSRALVRDAIRAVAPKCESRLADEAGLRAAMLG